MLPPRAWGGSEARPDYVRITVDDFGVPDV